MTQREKFFETVGILVEAYMNGTLMHGNCAACAVGNIIAAKLNCKIGYGVNSLGNRVSQWLRGGKIVSPLWTLVFCSRTDGSQFQEPRAYCSNTKQQIDASGYSWQELARIEIAFERAANYDSSGAVLNPDEAMFDGLMAVTNVLAEIHGIDLSERESAKLLFTKSSVS